MIRCIIIEDEKPARKALSLMIKQFFADKIEVVGEAESVAEGVVLIRELNPDIVFLDIHFNDENGFDLFNHFEEIAFSVVFVTAFRDYAIQAFKVSALDFLLKPINIDDLRATISLFEKKQLKKINKESVEKYLKTANALNSLSRNIILPSFYGFNVVKVNTIIYCQAEQNYTKVFLTDFKEFLVSKQLNFFEKKLQDNSFFRIHKSYLVNLNFVQSYSRINGPSITLENGTCLPVSVRKNEQLIQLLKNR